MCVIPGTGNLAGVVDYGPDGVTGMELTQNALGAHIGFAGPAFASIAILILSKTVYRLTKDYFDQRSRGEQPVFKFDEHPELTRGIDASIWNRDVEAERKG